VSSSRSFSLHCLVKCYYILDSIQLRQLQGPLSSFVYQNLQNLFVNMENILFETIFYIRKVYFTASNVLAELLAFLVSKNTALKRLRESRY